MSHKAPATDAAIGAMKIHAARAALRKIHDTYCEIPKSIEIGFSDLVDLRNKCNEVFLDILLNHNF